jgi:hypothetical protein
VPVVAPMLAGCVLVLAGCTAQSRPTGLGSAASRSSTTDATTMTTVPPTSSTTTTAPPTTTTTAPPPVRIVALPTPAPLAPFVPPASSGEGVWTPAGRPIGGVPAVYETTLVPPGGTAAAGLAWMDTKLLSAQLYSGSKSPGGGPYTLTAPVLPAQAASLVAAFNGGFLMQDAEGGYYTEGRAIDPLVDGAASLVIYSDGSVTVGAWGSDVTMTPAVVAVRQNLVPLVEGGQPTAEANADWHAWGATCGATSCASSVPGLEYQWRSSVGITADGALVYAAGPALNPIELADLLVRAGVVRGMELDINPSWPVFATYDPPPSSVLAAPSNGSSLEPASVQGPSTFFNPAWARDFVTMSSRVPTTS